METSENTPESIEEARKARERAQQANWFLGGTLFVISLAVGISFSMARNDVFIAFISLGIGAVLFWAVTRFAKK